MEISFLLSSLPFIFSVATGLVILFLGVLVYLQNRREFINRVFFWLTFSTLLWILSVVIRFNVRDPSAILISTRWSYATSAIIAFLINYFSYYFPRKNIYKLPLSLIVTATIIVGYLSVFTPYIIADVVLIDSIQENVFGPLLFIFAIYFPVVVGWGIYNLFSKRHSLNQIGRSQVDFLLTGLTLSTIFGFSTNFVIPVLTQTSVTEPYGPLSVIFFILLTSYAILKRHLFNIKVIATEAFTLLLLITLFVSIFTADNITNRVFAVSIFLGASVFSFLLIRSVIKEVEARKKIEHLAKNLRSANEKLKKLDKTKSEFISIASHQLRTPLTAIKGYIAMILDNVYGEPKPEIKEALKKVFLSNERLVGLVNELLDISRIERGKFKFDFKKIDLGSVIKSVLAEIAPQAKAKNLKIIYQPHPLPNIVADPDKLRHVFLNLLDNAIRYTNEGHITLRSKVTADFIIITIKDTGVGMTPEIISKLFKGFQRGENVAKTHPEGTGIGLYVAKQIIDAHGGTIKAESKGPGKGSQFIISLPQHLKTSLIKPENHVPISLTGS